MGSMDDDVSGAVRAGIEVEKRMTDGGVPCPGRDGVACGRNCLPGQIWCRHHGGSAVEVVTRAASAVRLESARAMIQSELSEGIMKAVGLYLAVLDDGLCKTADRIAAADRLIALSGGVEALRAADSEVGEMSGPVAALQALLEAAGDERLERLARRLGATNDGDGDGDVEQDRGGSEPVRGESAYLDAGGGAIDAQGRDVP